MGKLSQDEDQHKWCRNCCILNPEGDLWLKCLSRINEAWKMLKVWSMSGCFWLAPKMWIKVIKTQRNKHFFPQHIGLKLAASEIYYALFFLFDISLWAVWLPSALKRGYFKSGGALIRRVESPDELLMMWSGSGSREESNSCRDHAGRAAAKPWRRWRRPPSQVAETNVWYCSIIWIQLYHLLPEVLSAIDWLMFTFLESPWNTSWS